MTAAKGRPNRVAIDNPRYPTFEALTTPRSPSAARAACQSSAIRSRTASVPSAAMRAWYSRGVISARTRSPWYGPSIAIAAMPRDANHRARLTFRSLRL
jgi:hypothetical protein